MWEISERLKNEVREDVIWKKEAEVEAKVISMLQEIKDQVMLEDEYVHDLYRKEFKAKLKEKEHTWIWDTFKKLNNIKLWIIERELNKRKGEILEPNRVTKNVIYPVCGISMDINKNWKVLNVMKGVIDELMALPDMVAEIAKHPIDFAKGMARIIQNPGQMIKSIVASYTDIAWWWGTPESQYKTWRSATLIVLTFFPWWWWWKWLLNIAKKSPRLMKKASRRTQVEIRNASKHIDSKTAIRKKPRSEKIEDKVRRETGYIEGQWKKVWDKAKQGAEKRAVESQQKHVENAAKRKARWAERELIRQRSLTSLKNKMNEAVSKINLKNNPVSKVKEYATRRTTEKLDAVREWILKRAYPKFYKDLKTLESKTRSIKKSVVNASKDLENALAKKIELNRKITDLKKLVDKGGAHQIEWKWGTLNHQKLVDQLTTYEKDLLKLEIQTEKLNKDLYKATQALVIHNRVIKQIKKYPTSQMWYNTNIAGQLFAEVQFAIEWEMDREIDEAKSQMEQTLEELNKEIDEEYAELLNGLEKWIETWKADVSDVNLNVPHWCDLSKVDPGLYSISVIWRASKTWWVDLNKRLATQRAENAKQKIIEQYWLNPATTKFDIKIDLQTDHQDKMNEDPMLWQGIEVKITPVPWKERAFRDALVETSIDD